MLSMKLEFMQKQCWIREEMEYTDYPHAAFLDYRVGAVLFLLKVKKLFNKWQKVA